MAEKFGTEGSPISLSTACASGASAIQLGVEAIRRGETDAALCVGTDGSVNPESLIRFSLLSALSVQNEPPHAAAKPFAKNRDGFVMAEGAGALVLESYEAAVARGAKILGVIAGCGELADGFHRTRSSPDGKPIIGCMRSAIADAGLTPEDIDYINAHGTGTPENDKMECLGVVTVFGERAKDVPISSNKSMVGHTLSAAGAVEAVITLMTLEPSAHSADHQLPGAGPVDPARRRAQYVARRADPQRHLQFVRLRRPERHPGAGAGAGMMASAGKRHVLVTGGGRGLGAAIVAALAADGHDVTFTFRTAADEAQAAAQALGAAYPGQRFAARPVDLADRAAVEEFAAAMGDEPYGGLRPQCRPHL